ncbi:MAG: hypothetical protein QM790_11610 [Nibricoccus sp.]
MTWLRLLSLICLCTLPAHVRAAEQWIHARTSHFEMYSAASERDSRRYLNELEQFHSALHQLLKLHPVGGTRVTVVLFNSNAEFEPFTPVYQGRPKQVAGYYHRGLDGDSIALSAEAQALGDGDDNVVFHEYIHRLFDDQGIRLPVWLNEGLAVFFSTMRVKKQSIEIGYPAQRRLNNLAQSAMMPLKKLFAVTPSSTEYTDDARSGVFYAQSWLLLHYLICGTDKNIQGKLTELINALDETPTLREARFKEIFGMSYAQMEIVLRGYMTGGSFRVRSMEIPVGDFADELRFEPVSDTERDLVLEDLKWRVRPDSFDLSRLREMAQGQTDAARAFEAMGAHALSRLRDRAAAEAYWEKAVEHGSDNPYVYLQLARKQLNPLVRALDLRQRVPEKLCEPVRRYLDRALALRPDYLEAWEALAQFEAFAENPRSELVERAGEVAYTTRNPSSILAAVAIVYWRKGDYDRCEALLNEIEHSRPSDVTEQMVRLLTEQLARAKSKSTEALRPRRTNP